MEGLAEEIWDVADEVELTADRKAIVFGRQWRKGRGPYAALLGEFLALKDADDEAILNFARRNGPLWLCEEHGIPATHLRVIGSTTEGVADALAGHSPSELRRRLKGHREQIADWRAFISQAAAIARAAKHVRTGTKVAADLWAEVESRSQIFDQMELEKGTAVPLRFLSASPDDPWTEVAPASQPLDSVDSDKATGTPATRSQRAARAAAERERIVRERRRIQIVVQRWLDWSDVGVGVVWINPSMDGADADMKLSAAKPALRLVERSLFGSVALQLAQTLTGGQKLAICSYCGEPFEVERQPPVGQDHFCKLTDACKKERARRYAERRRRGVEPRPYRKKTE